MVCLPRRQHTNPTQNSLESSATNEDTNVSVNVPHDIVAAVLKAKHFNPMDGNRTSNFAVPILEKDWSVLGQDEAEAEENARKEAGEEGIFYQVCRSLS
jgi:hypothetical protein